MVGLINLSDLVQNIVTAYIEQNSNVKANFDIENNIRVSTNFDSIQSVIKILIDNAIKASAGKERPLVVFGKVDREDTFYIKDNGTGFNSNLSVQYFSNRESAPENNSDSDHNEIIKIKRIMETLGGKIWAVGNENSGTTIYFTVY